MKLDMTPEGLAQELLGRKFEELDEDEQRVLRRVSTHRIELDPDEQDRVTVAFSERLADRVAAIGGSWGFIVWFGAIVLLWMLVNSPMMVHLFPQWDTYPYIFLNLMLSTLAAFQAPIIMMSQNRQSIKDRIANRHDYEVNLRTTVELILMKRKIDYIMVTLHRMEQKAGAFIEKMPDIDAIGKTDQDRPDQ